VTWTKTRYLGSEVPDEDLIWQDPSLKLITNWSNEEDITILKEKIMASVYQSESWFTLHGPQHPLRGSDKRGGANGAASPETTEGLGSQPTRPVRKSTQYTCMTSEGI
jgi:catalase (peroxidase I)